MATTPVDSRETPQEHPGQARSGAIGDGTTDNLAAIQNAFNNAAANHCIALVPAGTFAYSGNLTATGIAIAGVGVALAIKTALIEHNIPGKVVLLGTPGIYFHFFVWDGV